MIDVGLLLPLLYHKDAYKQKSKSKKIKFQLTNGLLSSKTSHKDMQKQEKSLNEIKTFEVEGIS